MTDLNSLDDEQLIHSVLNGNREVFSRLVEQYQRLVLSLCRQRISDSFEAENAAQETFLAAYRSLSLYAHNGFKSWLVRIAINKCNDYYRSLKHTELVELDQAAELPSGEDSPLEQALTEERRQEVRQLLSQLPEKYEEVLTAYYLKGKTVAQIAQEQDAKPKTVETRLYRGLKILKNRKEELL